MFDNVNKEMTVVNIPISEIFADPELNCRGEIAPYDCIELARSIEKNGLQSPIVVQPYTSKEPYKFRIVSGHRRHKAFIINGQKAIPAIIKEGLTEIQVRVLNLQENLERKNLNLLQEAQSIKKFKDAGYTLQEVAKMCGLSTGWVQVRYNLLELEPEIQDTAAAGFLTQEQIKDIYSMGGKENRFEAVKKIKESRLRGEKKAIKIKKPKKNPLAKKIRGKEEIQELNELIIDTIGANLATRCLAWAAGEISDADLYRDMRKICREKNIPDYAIPKYGLESNYDTEVVEVI